MKPAWSAWTQKDLRGRAPASCVLPDEQECANEGRGIVSRGGWNSKAGRRGAAWLGRLGSWELDRERRVNLDMWAGPRVVGPHWHNGGLPGQWL